MKVSQSAPATRKSAVDLKRVYGQVPQKGAQNGKSSIAIETPANVLKQQIAAARQQLRPLLNR